MAEEPQVDILQEQRDLPPDERHEFKNGTLVIPGRIVQEMKALDRFVVEQTTDAEIVGYGLTKQTGNTTEVVEFVAPTNVFTIIHPAIDRDDKFSLMYLMSQAQTMELSISNECVRVTGTGLPPNGELELTFNIYPMREGKEISWGYTEEDLSRAFGLEELPDSIDELKEMLQRNKELLGKERLTTECRWDLIVSDESALTAATFLNKVGSRATAIGAKVGFSMHHHPNKNLDPKNLELNSADEIQKYLTDHTGFSYIDLLTAARQGLSHFEIRAMGTGTDPNSKVETTRRIYSIEEIKEETNEFKTLIDDLLASRDDNNVETALNFASRLSKITSTLTDKGYTLRSILPFCFGEDNWGQLTREHTNLASIRSNTDLILYHLIETFKTNALPQFSEDLFRTRTELNVALVVNKIGKLLQDNQKADKVRETLDSLGGPFITNLPVDTKPDNIKYIVEKLTDSLGAELSEISDDTDFSGVVLNVDSYKSKRATRKMWI